MKHALSREQTFFCKIFECYLKEKATQEKPKHEFAYTAVVLLLLAGSSANISDIGPFRSVHPPPHHPPPLTPSSVFTR